VPRRRREELPPQALKLLKLAVAIIGREKAALSEQPPPPLAESQLRLHLQVLWPNPNPNPNPNLGLPRRCSRGCAETTQVVVPKPGLLG